MRSRSKVGRQREGKGWGRRGRGRGRRREKRSDKGMSLQGKIGKGWKEW